MIDKSYTKDEKRVVSTRQHHKNLIMGKNWCRDLDSNSNSLYTLGLEKLAAELLFTNNS